MELVQVGQLWQKPAHTKVQPGHSHVCGARGRLGGSSVLSSMALSLCPTWWLAEEWLGRGPVQCHLELRLSCLAPVSPLLQR